jgi:hypothetical protein
MGNNKSSTKLDVLR